MYNGEIKVKENELVTVLSTAQALEIKGLSESNNTTNETKNDPVSKPCLKTESPKRPAPQPVTPGYYQNTSRKKQRIIPSNNLTISDRGSNPVPGIPTPKTKPPPPSQPELVPVKQEMAPVTVDLDCDDQHGGGHGGRVGGGAHYTGGGGSANYGSVGQEMVYSDTSVVAGYEGEGGYEEGEYYNEGMGHQDYQDERVEKIMTENCTVLWKCKECGKASAYKNNLIRHTLSHTGVKQFSCKFCNIYFVSKSNMKRHEQKCKLNPFAVI